MGAHWRTLARNGVLPIADHREEEPMNPSAILSALRSCVGNPIELIERRNVKGTPV